MMPRLHIAPHRVFTEFLSAPQHAAMLDWSLANEPRFKPAQLNEGRIDPQIRRSLVLRDLGNLREILQERIEAIVAEAIRDLRVTPFVPSEMEFELAAHNDGAHFAFHADTYTGGGSGQRSDRMLSGVYYFHREPKAFSGGELRLHRLGAAHDDDGYLDLVPTQNSFVIFPAWAPHEVRPVQCPSREFADSRFAVNCWIRRAAVETAK